MWIYALWCSYLQFKLGAAEGDPEGPGACAVGRQCPLTPHHGHFAARAVPTRVRGHRMAIHADERSLLSDEASTQVGGAWW